MALIRSCTGTPNSALTSRRRLANAGLAEDTRARAKHASRDNISRMSHNHNTSWPVSGCKPSIARIARQGADRRVSRQATGDQAQRADAGQKAAQGLRWGVLLHRFLLLLVAENGPRGASKSMGPRKAEPA